MRTSDQWVVTREFTDDPGPVSDPVADLSVPGGALINGVWQRHDLRLPVTDRSATGSLTGPGASVNSPVTTH